MKLIAAFDFNQKPASLGTLIHVGDDRFFTLAGKPKPYVCDLNELLVITALTHEGDKFGMLKDVNLVIDGRFGYGVGAAVQPGESLGVQLRIKCANDFHLPPAIIDYPIRVNIIATQYQVTNISP
jgi:hypothetical protein